MYPTVSYDPPTFSTEDYSWVSNATSSGPAGPSKGGVGLDTASSTLPTLRVVIAEPFRIAPPVTVSARLQGIFEASPSGQQAPIRRNPSNKESFEYEQRILQQASENLSAASAGTPSPALDPWRAETAKFEAMGFDAMDVALAGAVIGEAQASPDAMAEACRAVADLRSMGFDPVRVAGALALHRGNLSAATEACLAASD